MLIFSQGVFPLFLMSESQSIENNFSTSYGFNMENLHLKSKSSIRMKKEKNKVIRVKRKEKSEMMICLK